MSNCHECKNKVNNDTEYICYVHKDRQYGGYSKNEYPRLFCSNKCLNKYEKTGKCNLCNIIIYDWSLIKKGDDDYLYCDDNDQCNIGNDTCYNLKFMHKN